MKRAISLFIALLMIGSLFTGLSVSAADNSESIESNAAIPQSGEGTRVSDLADTGDNTEYTSINGQYRYTFLDDGTIRLEGLAKPDRNNSIKRTWFMIPSMIDGYQVSALSYSPLGVSSWHFYVPAGMNIGDKNTYKNYRSDYPLAVVYEHVRPSSHHSGNKDDIFYPLYEYHLKDDDTAVLDIIRPNGSSIQVIPDTLWDGTEISEIGPQAFKSVPGLYGDFAYVEISHVFDSIGQGYFSGFPGQRLTLHVTGETQIAEGAFDGLQSSTKIVLSFVGDNDIPAGICPEEVGKKVSVKFSGEIKQIKNGAFAHSSIGDITINGNVKTVGANAFSDSGAESLTLKNGVKTIGEKAFYRCGFTEVTIPKSVTQIGDYAFGYTFDAKYETVKKIDGFTIYGYRNTAAQRYANDNGFTFVPLDQAFDLWLGTTQVTTDNMEDIFGDGKASFDPDDNTLMLNNPVIKGSYHNAKIYAGTTVGVKGSYRMTAAETDYGIKTTDTLTLYGDFTFIGKDTGVCSGTHLYIESGSLTASGRYGVRVGEGGWLSVMDDTEKTELTGSEAAVADYAEHIVVSPKKGIVVPTGGTIKELDQDRYQFSDSIGNIAKRVVIMKRNTLSEFSATVDAPVAGKKPSYRAAIPAGKGYRLKNIDGKYIKNGVRWRDENYNNLDPDTAVFEEGKIYRVYVYLEPVSEDYHLALSGRKGSVNGEEAEVWIDSTENHVFLIQSFTCKANSGVLLGDADTDDEVTIFDATAIQRYLAQLSVTKFSEDAADADEDGDVTIFDATAIQRYLAQLPTNPNIGKIV